MHMIKCYVTTQGILGGFACAMGMLHAIVNDVPTYSVTIILSSFFSNDHHKAQLFDVYKDPTNLFFQMAMIECETILANLTGPIQQWETWLSPVIADQGY